MQVNSCAPTQPSAYEQPPGHRSRHNSYTDRYNPSAYPEPAQNQPDPNLLGSGQILQQQPTLGPDARVMPPYQSRSSHGPPQGLPVPQQQLQASYAKAPYAPPRRPSESDPRRHSYSSAHSKRSHERRKSHESRHSHHSHHVQRSSEDDEERRERHRREEGRHSGKGSRDDQKKNQRPTLGDTLFGMFDVIKSALGPRDKY